MTSHSTMILPAPARPMIMGALLGSLVFSLSCLVSVRLQPGHAGSDSVLGRLLGAGRVALGTRFYGTADQYFHRGVGHTRKVAFDTGFFRSLQNAVSPNAHAHLQSYSVSEMMPWLRLATRLNPQDVETYLVTAFWLNRECDRPDLALELLNEAQVENPFDYRIQFEKGKLYLKLRRYERARQALNAGLAFWPRGPAPTQVAETDVRFDLNSLRLYRAMVAEMEGDTPTAVLNLQAILDNDPRRADLRNRLEDLQAGRSPSRLAGGLIADSLESEDRERSACHRGDEHTHDGGPGTHEIDPADPRVPR